MPQSDFYPRRYNSLRLLGYEYNSTYRLCAITLVTELRCPFFADLKLAKSILASLLSEWSLHYLRMIAFTLMPDHLHLLAGVSQPESNLPTLIGRFKSYTTQLYWKRSREIAASGQVVLPPRSITRSNAEQTQPILAALLDWRANLRPEVVPLQNWPAVQPAQFLLKQLWQSRFFDHVIRNDDDLRRNIDYIAMNPVRAGYVTRPQFYPYTGLL